MKLSRIVRDAALHNLASHFMDSRRYLTVDYAIEAELSPIPQELRSLLDEAHKSLVQEWPMDDRLRQDLRFMFLLCISEYLKGEGK